MALAGSFALWKNPENLTARQQSKLAGIDATNRPLFRAYLLKEQLRQIYRLGAEAEIEDEMSRLAVRMKVKSSWASEAPLARLRPGRR